MHRHDQRERSVALRQRQVASTISVTLAASPPCDCGNTAAM